MNFVPMLTRSLLVLCLALTVLCPFAHAEVIELEGVVKAVDAEARTVSIERKTAKGTKTLDLEVNKKAGDLSAVKVGDAVSFSYDPGLEVVTKIGGNDVPVAMGQELVALKELRKGYNTAPWVSEDGLRLFWQSAEQDGTRWIWTASRTKPNGLWEGQAKVVPGSDPTLTSDELNLYVFEAGTICVATRQSREESFSRPQPIAELKQLGMLARPCVSADGLLLWCDRKDTGTVRVSRTKVSEPWGEQKVVDRKVVGMGNGFVINSVSGYGVFALGSPVADGHHFAFATTADMGLSFSSPRPLALPNNADGKFPFYCEATNELYFAGQQGQDKTSQLYVVRNCVLPNH